MNNMPPSVIKMNRPSNENSNESNINVGKLNYQDVLSDKLAESLKISSNTNAEGNGNSLWNSNAFHAGGGMILSSNNGPVGNEVVGSGAGTSSFNGEDLLELHRQQIMQNTNKHGTNGSKPRHQTQHSGAPSPEADGRDKVTAAHMASFANSRWNNLSSPSLQYYGHQQQQLDISAHSQQDLQGFGSAYSSNALNHSVGAGSWTNDSSSISDKSFINQQNQHSDLLNGSVGALSSNILQTSLPTPPPQHHAPPHNMSNPPANTTAPGGVFYMAVPVANNGANGAAQAVQLQPVQMMQLPNGQQTLVFAPPAAQTLPNSHSMPNLQLAGAAPIHLHQQQQLNHPYHHSTIISTPTHHHHHANLNGQVPNSHNQGGGRGKKDHHNHRGRGNNVNGKNNGSLRSSKHDIDEMYAVDDGKFDSGMNNSSHGNNSKNSSNNNGNNASSSASNDVIAALYQSTRRPALSELLGHVRRLSRDQVGCRLLQQSLDEDGPEAATAILQEGLPFLAEAMTDPFGNYLFQKILEKVNSEERLKLISTVSARLVNAALNLHGTRSVQKVVEVAANDDRAAEIVTRWLAPAVARLCIDSHGNHVVQRVLQRLPHPHAKFVFDAVANAVGDVARHRHGCCVIQRCLDSPHSAARSNLVMRIVEKALDLMQDAYGNYVVQYVLDVCGEDEAAAVCESVVGRVSLLAVQKFSSNVMEKCLERSGDRVQELYLQEMSHPDKIRELMCDPFGNYVVQRGLSVATHAQAVRLVEAMRPHLPGMRNTAGGRRIVAKISRRFPNFTMDGPNVSNQQAPVSAPMASNVSGKYPNVGDRALYVATPNGGNIATTHDGNTPALLRPQDLLAVHQVNAFNGGKEIHHDGTATFVTSNNFYSQ